MFKKQRIYLDYAASTPLFGEARKAMLKVMKHTYGNPSAIHREGQQARAVVEKARKQLATTVQIKPEYVTFTSGGTESNNIAVIGLIEQLHTDGRKYEDMQIITTRIEHPSVTEAFLALKRRGVQVDFVAVDDVGKIRLENLQKLMSGNTVLVSVAYANSEIGTVQPIHALSKIIKNAEKAFSSKTFFHIDAAQAPLWLSCQFESLDADLVSLDFAKCGGPKGTGALLRSKRVQVSPVLFGGGQENGLRSGTENVLGIVGGTAAFVAAQKRHKKRIDDLTPVRDSGIEMFKAIDPKVVLNGPLRNDRIANNINISIPGVDTEYLSVWLDTKGFAVSTKSACAGAGGGESAVVKEISADPPRAKSTLRVTLGPDTTMQNVSALVSEIIKYLETMS